MIVSLSYVTIKTEHFCSLSLNLCSQLALDWRTRRTRCCWRCHRSCWRLPITWSWAATSTGQCCYPKGSACTPTSRSPSSSKKTPTSPMATGPTCPPSCVSEGGKDISKCDIFAPVSWINVWVSSALQHFYPVQWDREHLEPPSRFPALLLSGGQRPFVCPASLWSQQGRLCHLCYRTLLLPGNSRLTEDLSEPFRTPHPDTHILLGVLRSVCQIFKCVSGVWNKFTVCSISRFPPQVLQVWQVLFRWGSLVFPRFSLAQSPREGPMSQLVVCWPCSL